jgi:hypothetical protein
MSNRTKMDNPPDECPKCKNDAMDSYYGNVEIDGHEVHQKVHCHNCDTIWFEVYKFNRVEVCQ